MSRRKKFRLKKFKQEISDSTSEQDSLCAPGHHIYTDGSYRPDGNAACAYVIFSGKSKNVIRMERLAYRGSTINAMELMAVNRALDHPNMEDVTIYSDSMYTISCLTLWRYNWEKNNWITPLNEPVKNRDLIKEICRKIDLLSKFKCVKIAAHTGNPFNSLVDYMANSLTLMMRDNPQLPDGVHPM